MAASIAAASLIVMMPVMSRAEDHFAAKLESYADTDHVKVIRPSVAASADVAKGLELGATYTVDVITAASVDVVTSATLPVFSDRRREIGGSTTYRGAAGLVAGVSYADSAESDYRSRTGTAHVARDFFERNTTLSVRVGAARDSVGSVIDARFKEPLDTWAWAVGLTQVLSPRLVAQVGYEGASLEGYQQSPYRSVRFGAFTYHLEAKTPIFEGTTGVRLEHQPRERLRHEGTGALAWYLGDEAALHGFCSLYLDDWGVVSHAGEVQLLKQLGAGTVLRVRGRLYHQAAADFYRRQYTGLPGDYEYYSADKRLGRLWSELAGGKLDHQVFAGRASDGFSRVGADIKVEGIFEQYPDYLFLSHKAALVTQVGLHGEF